ncbi:O-antigen ligase family protein [Paenibacillus odorifer]|jgi:hypothetical protein|uniref:O-antigen ligase family protein n=1 Tax=Paenibacillus odorifer TaxID=189426 RepID=UPI00096CC83E|nr:O-antigen ligase family protein [Paenibacillus odorifer]OMD89411.1 hypothetical protein BSK67_25135 [Paenibacillus odorifer]
MEAYRKIKKQKPNQILYYTIPYLILILLSIKTFSSRYITFGFVMLFLIVFALAEKKIIIGRKYAYFIWFIMGYGFLGILYGDLNQIVKNICMIILSFAPFFIYDWMFSDSRKDRRLQNSKLIIKVMTPVLIYTVFVTLYYLNSNPYVARNMANYDPSISTNINLPLAIGGGYVLIYGIIFLPPVLLYLAKNICEKLLSKILLLLIALFLLYFIVKSGFATAFIISFAGSLLAVMLTQKQKTFNRVFLTSIILITSIIFLNIEIFSEVISSIIRMLPENSIITIRLNEIIPTLYGNISDSTSFSRRLNNLDMTIDSFLGNPILGIGYKVGFDYSAISLITGQHTEWLDNLSQYGLFLGVPYLLYFATSFRGVIRQFKSTNLEVIMSITILMMILLGFLNPILTSSAFLVTMLYIPCLLIIFSENRENDTGLKEN